MAAKDSGWIDGPASSIAAVVKALAGASDAEVLAALAAVEPLPDEGDVRWNDHSFWFDVAYVFLGIAEVAQSRKLRPAVRLVLERASYGDPGETMRGIRHVCEGIFDPDWTALADEYLALARAERLGTRLWAIANLTVLADPRAVPILEASLREDPEDIRWWAETGLERVLHPERAAAVAAQARVDQERDRLERLNQQAKRDATITGNRCAACGKPMPTYRRTCKHCGTAVVT